MMFNSPHHILDQLKWRYATKQFDPTKFISSDLWEKIEDMLVLSPSSYGLQPYKFIVIKNPETRQKLMAVSWNQKQVTAASHFIVFTHRTDMTEEDVARYMERAENVLGKSPAQDNYKKIILNDLVNGPRRKIAREWAARQAYIALGHIMVATAAMGIDTCPMEGISPADYDAILGLEKSGYATVVALALGYRAETDKYAAVPKVRLEKKDLISTI